MKRYVIALRGKYSGQVHEVTFADFSHRKSAEAFLARVSHHVSPRLLRTEEMTEWFVHDRSPWWQRRQRRF